MANDENDVEQQFQKDLERAQALSLESLALEQYRNLRRLQPTNISSNDSIKTNRSSSVTRTSSMNETDSKNERLQVMSRPRPGISPSNAGASILAPPPGSQKKNGNNGSAQNAAPDLISFTSPPNTGTTDFCQQIINLNNINNKSNIGHSSNLVQNQTNFQQYDKVLMPSNSNPLVRNYTWTSCQYASSSMMHSTRQPAPMSYIQNNPPVSSMMMSVSNYAGNSSNNMQAPPLLPRKMEQQTPPLPPVASTNLRKLSIPNKEPEKKIASSGNLIDLGDSVDDRNSVRVSILEAFDPLLNDAHYNSRTLSPECPDDSASVCDSVYDEYDPYDFIYSGSGSNSTSDPIYAAVVKSESAPLSPPPLPPKLSTMEKRKIKKESNKSKSFDNILPIDRKKGKHDADLISFYKMVRNLRTNFKFDDPDTNMGLIVSPMMTYNYREGSSIKLCVYPRFNGMDSSKPIAFTCDVTSSVEHVTLQMIYNLEAPTDTNYTLKVWGYNEYLVPTTLLCDYEYIHNCIKLEEDVNLILIPDSDIDKSLARTVRDDKRDKDIEFKDIVPNEPLYTITYEQLRILLETLENEIQKVEKAAIDIDKNGLSNVMPPLQSSAVVQSVKLVVKLMGTLETPEITEALNGLEQSCNRFIPNRGEQINDWEINTVYEIINKNCEKIRASIQNLIEMYSQAFGVDFEVQSLSDNRFSTTLVSDVADSVLFRILAIHRPMPQWTHDNYIIATQIYHGTRPLGHPVLSQAKTLSNSHMLKYPRILYESWIDMDICVCSLAKESRLVLVIYGRTLEAPEKDEKDKDAQPQYKQEEIGWASVQFFNYEGVMVQGNILLSIWPKESNYIYGPAPSPGTHPIQDHPVLSIEMPGPNKVIFPQAMSEPTHIMKYDFNSLDLQTQQTLKDVAAQDMLYKPELDVREILWEKRHYLHNIPEALPKVLLAAHSWDWACLTDLHTMLHTWNRLPPMQAIQLLLPTFPDVEVRKKAVQWLRYLTHDELVDILHQLVVALRHETYENSELAYFLLDRALRSPRVAHHLFWLLSHSLPGAIPQNECFEIFEREVVNIGDIRHHRRLLLILRSLLAICGENLRNCFISQQMLVKELYEIAQNVQNSKESQRLNVLNTSLLRVHDMLKDNPTSLPLSPTLKVVGINVKNCAYFPSFTLPLKLSFLAKDGSIIPAIFKVGDDLQQDMLTLQIVRIMDKLWLKENLDLKIVAFNCVPTGRRRGMIELVAKAETLRKIQTELGLTGSFKDRPIAEWLAKHNPSELEYGRAVENFTASCAGYCVVTYVLGICDRHNDNIMLKTSGHLFHIDFGKFLGDAQMFGNFKRDRTPFVLTSDMAYVINGGDRPSEKFHKFVDLCCQAFNVVRKNCNLFLYLFTLMASSGIRGVTMEAVSNLHNALMPGQSNAEAAAYFARLIESSLKSWFTQFNFFLHNLAQLKFTGDHGDGELLSFVPKTYNMHSDGRLKEVSVLNYQKRYDPDKYYVYVLRVKREGQNESMDLFRTYKEFCELHQKLCLHFPLAKLHSLSNGLHVGRSNIKQVAEKRLKDVSQFLTSLFRTADEIAHSDLVYTFFHPLLRDQQASDQFSRKVKDRRMEERSEIGRLKGQLKLSLQYSRGVFRVMVHHVRSLPLVGNSQEPSSYVKVYLLPDPDKTTKRKTKVIKKNCHPTFMEMLEYRMLPNVISQRVLRATVWNYDALQENEFLGGVDLPLSQFDLQKEISEWYPLTNLTSKEQIK